VRVEQIDHWTTRSGPRLDVELQRSASRPGSKLDLPCFHVVIQGGEPK
jgi:hypothetical protein